MIITFGQHGRLQQKIIDYKGIHIHYNLHYKFVWFHLQENKLASKHIYNCINACCIYYWNVIFSVNEACYSNYSIQETVSVHSEYCFGSLMLEFG
jgi:hypothetical protein